MLSADCSIVSASLSYSMLFEDSTQCIMSFTPASDANTALMGGLTITSLMVAE